MKRIIAIFAVAALTGCASIPGGTELAAVGTAAVDALTGPDSDYKNYLSHCRAEVKAQAEAIKAENEVLQAGLSSGSKEAQQGALLVMAFKAGQGGPRVGCSVARKKGFTELLLENNSMLDFGLRLYEVNRADKRFSRQLSADQEMFSERLKHERGMADRQNLLINTLTGNEERLRGQQNEYELDRQRLNQQAPPVQ